MVTIYILCQLSKISTFNNMFDLAPVLRLTISSVAILTRKLEVHVEMLQPELCSFWVLFNSE